MSKASTHIKSVLGYAVLIGFAIQIMLGLSYVCFSLTDFQQFGDSYLYMKASNNFIFDEYTGILYPLFLLCIGGGAEMISAPSCILLKVLQLTVAFVSGYLFVKTMRKTNPFLCAFGSLSMMTIPAIMQCHTAALPISLTVSFLVLELVCFVRFLKKEGKTWCCFLGMGIFWVLQTMLMTEYALFGGIFILIATCTAFVLAIKQKQKQWTYSIVISMAAFLLVCTTVGSLRYLSKSDRPIREAETMIFSRFAGSCLSSTYGYWPEDLKSCVEEQTVLQCEKYPLSRELSLVKPVEDTLGMKRAKEVFLQVAKTGYQVSYRQVRHEIVVDMAAYVFSPIYLQYQLRGRGTTSFSGRNVDIMKVSCPVLVKKYLDYGSWWFAASLGISLLWFVSHGIWLYSEKKWKWNREYSSYVVSVTAVCSGMVFWYTMQGAGMMDYKNTIFLLLAFWMIQSKGGYPT